MNTKSDFRDTKIYTVSDYIEEFLASQNVSGIFNLSGGMTAFIVDALSRRCNTEIINCKTEQSAGFAAEGAARVTGVPAVALATSGPGATNLVTAIASCFFDSTPVIFVTGQVHSSEIRTNPNQRQNGFQELDIVTMVKGITKAMEPIS